MACALGTLRILTERAIPPLFWLCSWGNPLSQVPPASITANVPSVALPKMGPES